MYKRGCFTVKSYIATSEASTAYDVAVDALCKDRERVSAGVNPICYTYIVKMESQPSPTCRILQIQEWPIFAEFELYVHLARHISSLVFYSPFFSLMYLLIIMGFFYGSLSHRQKCCILPMNDKKTGGEINQTMTTIRLWGIYHVHGLISLTRPGNDNWTRTPFKRILHYRLLFKILIHQMAERW